MIKIESLVRHLVTEYNMTHKEAITWLRESVTVVARDLKSYMGKEAFDNCRWQEGPGQGQLLHCPHLEEVKE